MCVWLKGQTGRLWLIEGVSWVRQEWLGLCCGFPPSRGATGGDARRRGGLPLIKVSHGLNSSGSHYTQALVCGWFIAGWLSHKCHTNLYTSYLTSEAVRYVTNLSSLTLLTCTPTYELHCMVSFSFTSGDVHTLIMAEILTFIQIQ